MIEISIIIPVYNVEKYLNQCLESIYKLDLSNKEIILINDGSTDNSLNILKEYKEKYSEKTILISQENKGLSEARNIGVRSSSGKYILFIDSDDFVDYKILENFLKEGLYYKEDILMGNSSNYYGDRIIKDFYPDRLKNIGEKKGLFFLEERIKRKCFYLGVWRNLYKKEFLLKNNLFFEKGILHEDNLFTPIAFCLAEKVRYSQKYFYFYRQTNSTSITKSKNKKRYVDLLIIIEKLLQFSKEQKISNRYFNRIIIGMYLMIVNNGKIKDNRLFNEIKKLKLDFRGKIKIILIYFLSLKILENKNE